MKNNEEIFRVQPRITEGTLYQEGRRRLIWHHNRWITSREGIGSVPINENARPNSSMETFTGVDTVVDGNHRQVLCR